MKTRKQVRYSGRVQGVGFRVTAREIARRHPVTGWVRNEPDGSVLLEVQGSPAEVEAMLERLRAQMGARIVHESASDAGLVEGESAFVIRS